MKKNAAFRESFDLRSGLTLIGALAVGALLFAGTAVARPLAKDGQIHACYRVKGKPKGELRVVPSARAHCRRGERKVAWSAAGSSGFQGTSGQGGQGAQGQAGAAGSGAPDDAALKAQVGDLTLRVQALEGILRGITNGDLTGMLGTLQGLTNKGLASAVNSVGATEALCEQSEKLTEQVNLVAGVVESLGLNGVLTTLGGLLVIPALPDDLPAFNCPTS